MNMPYHWTSDRVNQCYLRNLKKNYLQDAYIRPVVYAPANMSFVQNDESFIIIEVWKMQPFLGESY